MSTHSLSPYINKLSGVMMDYPSDWKLSENVAGAVASFAPTEEDSVAAPCLNIVVQDLSANPLDLESFTDVSIYQMKHMLPDVTDLIVNNTTLAEHKGKNITYTTTLQGIHLKFRQIFTLKNDTAYIVTFSAPVPIHDQFTHLIEACARTLKLISKKGVASTCLAPVLNKPYSYFIRVPRGWERKEIKNGSVQRFEFRTKNDTPALVTLIVNVDYFPQSNLDEYTALVRDQISQIAVSKEIIVNDTQLAGVPAKRTTFYTTSTRIPGRYIQVWTVFNKFAGVITLIHNIPENEPEQDEYSPLFDRVLESFSFVKPDHVLDHSHRYDNLTLRFSINFPERFYPQEGFMGATVSFAVPEHTQAFGTNINVVVQRLPSQEVTLEEFCNTIKQQLDTTVNNIQTQKEINITVAGVMGKESQYSGNIENQNVRFVQRVALVNDLAVVLSFAVEAEKFEREYRTVGKYLDTFKFF